MTTTEKRVEEARLALAYAFGLVPLLAGLDKFTNLLANWPGYVSPLLVPLLPVSAQAFMHVVGVIEIAVGLAILTRWTAVGSYVAAVWLLCIAANLVLAGYFDIAVRDVVMAIAAYTLARLTEAKQAAGSIAASRPAARAAA